LNYDGSSAADPTPRTSAVNVADRGRHIAPEVPLGVRSEPTPPPRPRLDIAPPAPGRLPADSPTRFGQQPAVPPIFDQVSLDTEPFADIGKSNRLMLRVRVRHGAPGAYSQSERRGAWEPAPVAVDIRSVGHEVMLGLASRQVVPDPQASGRRETARRRGGTTRRAARREVVPWGALGNQGSFRPPVWRGHPNNLQANRPDQRSERPTATPGRIAGPP
jgi:hypothetical protein